LAAVAAIATTGSIGIACQSKRETSASRAQATAVTAPSRGGSATASVRVEPRSFNRLAARDNGTDLVSTLTQARLIRINKVTQDVEPWLAREWRVDADGRRYTLTLVDAAFSDGHPFTADDVAFSFQAAYDAKTQSPVGDTLLVDGKPIEAAAVDAHTVTLTFPSAFAPGLRLLNSLPILPKHKLDAALRNGTLASAWSVSTPPSDLAGLGPFVLSQYTPGQRLVFDRNPRYWRKDANGTALPYLDRLTLDVIPDQNAELLRLQAGQLDITASEVAPESYASTKRAADEGRVHLYDLGVALVADSFWFNLKPGSPGPDWLHRDELRRAISMAVDRKVFADTVFFGAGVPVDGPITPANQKWFSAEIPATPYDLDGAKKLLASIGLVDRNGDGVLEDAANHPAQFTLVTQKGRPRLERGASVVRDELRKIGLVMDVAALEGGAVIERIVTGKYDAVYFNVQTSDTDPATNLDFWRSSGSAHLWDMASPKPATDWERRIDELMTQQAATANESERRRVFTDVLRIFAEHQPVLYFAAPKVMVAVSSRTILTPGMDVWPALWSPDTIAVQAK